MINLTKEKNNECLRLQVVCDWYGTEMFTD